MSIESLTFGTSKEEKVNSFFMLMKDPEVQPVFRDYIENIIENVLATSELKVLKRIAALESKLGLNDFLDLEDEHEVTIQEQLSMLAERIDNVTEPVTCPEVIKEPAVCPKSTLEHKACELVEHLKTNANVRNGEVFLTSREVTDFLKYEIKEEYRIKDVKNTRQVKKDVIEKAQKMFPDNIFLSKKKHGNKDVRIIYKAYGSIHTVEK
jgi:hypothetical protein